MNQKLRRRRWKQIVPNVMPHLDRVSARRKGNVINWWIDFRVEHGKSVDIGTPQDVRDFFTWRDQQPVRMWSYNTDAQYAVAVRSWLRYWGGW